MIDACYYYLRLELTNKIQSTLLSYAIGTSNTEIDRFVISTEALQNTLRFSYLVMQWVAAVAGDTR